MAMAGYKKRIFVRVIKARMEAEQTTAEEIIKDYPKLTEEEKAELLAEINK